ncbi:hypothetical protein Barb4_01094 [Bacteroidales bacterium Barb4]|nr:hypothetical protein Barb4_01094 [Bacteroidales bacterium Barb4]
MPNRVLFRLHFDIGRTACMPAVVQPCPRVSWADKPQTVSKRVTVLFQTEWTPDEPRNLFLRFLYQGIRMFCFFHLLLCKCILLQADSL